MYSVTSTTPEPVFITHEKKFLIVPIIFRKQIEKFIESSENDGIGFIYGDDRETFSIIKKVWTIDDQQDLTDVDLMGQAREVASACGMKLLGLFYHRSDTSQWQADALNLDEDLASVELVIEDGITKEWVPHVAHHHYSGTIIEQKIIL